MIDLLKTIKKPVRWVLAVPNDSEIKCAEDLEGKSIATEGVGLVEKWLKEKGIKAKIEFSSGATEVKVKNLLMQSSMSLRQDPL